MNHDDVMAEVADLQLHQMVEVAAENEAWTAALLNDEPADWWW